MEFHDNTEEGALKFGERRELLWRLKKGKEGKDEVRIITQQPINTRSSSSEDMIPNSVEDRVYRPPPGQWNDGLCDWYKNSVSDLLLRTFRLSWGADVGTTAKKTKFLDKYFDGNKIFLPDCRGLCGSSSNNIRSALCEARRCTSYWLDTLALGDNYCCSC